MKERRQEPGNALQEALQNMHTIWPSIAMVNCMRVETAIDLHVKGILVSGLNGVHVQQLVAKEPENEIETAMDQLIVRN